jgi:hypothetical protein
MSKVEFGCEWQFIFSKNSIFDDAFVLIQFFINIGEYLLYGIISLFTFTPYIFFARRHIQFYGCQSGTLLSAVMLFFHQQVHFL